MEIASQVAKSKHESEEAAKRAYRELLTKVRPDDDVSEQDVAATITAMQVLGISTEEAEADARLYLDVITATADRDRAAEEVAKCGPEGETSFSQQLDDLDVALAEAIDRLLRPKRRLLKMIERFDAAALVLSSKESLLATKRNAVPRLTG